MSINWFLGLSISVCIGQSFILFWYKRRLHPITLRTLGLSNLVLLLLSIYMLASLKFGSYEAMPSLIRIILLFVIINAPLFLFLTIAGSVIYAGIRPQFPYMFDEYAHKGNFYVTFIQRNRGGIIKQIDVQWDENIVVGIPISEPIVQSKHRKLHFETYRIGGWDSLLLRLDHSNSNHYVFFPESTFQKISEFVQYGLENGQNYEKSETVLLLENEGIIHKTIVVDTFVLFDFPQLLPLLEQENRLILSKKVFESFPYDKVRQPQYREALSIVYDVFSRSGRIEFSEEFDDDAKSQEFDEVDRLIQIALEESRKGNAVNMLTTNNKLKLKCKHYKIPVIDAQRLLKVYNSASNPIYRFAFNDGHS